MPHQDPHDPFDSIWSEATGSDPDPFDSIWEEATVPKQGAAADFGSQALRGLGEAGYATATGVTKLAGLLPGIDTSKAVEGLGRSREEMREFYGEADTGWGVAGAVGGRILGEGATLAVGGGLARAGVAGAGKLAGRAGAQKAADVAGRLTGRAGTRLGRFGQDVAFGSPGDIALAAAGYEDSAAGGLGEVLDNDTLRRIGENPVARAAFEVGTGAVGAGAIHGVAAGMGKVGKAIDPSEAVDTGIREFGRQGSGTYGGDFTPARETRQGLGVGAVVKGPGGGRYTVQSIDSETVTIKDSQGFSRQMPRQKAEQSIMEPVEVEAEGPPFPATPEATVEETAQAMDARPRPDVPMEPEAPLPEGGYPGRRLNRQKDPLETPTFLRRGGRVQRELVSDDTEAVRIARDEPKANPLESLSDDELRRRHLNRIRTATIEEVRASGGGRNAAGRLSQSTEAADELGAEFHRRGLEEPDPDEAFVGVSAKDFPASIRNRVESVQTRLGDLEAMDDEALESALRQAEDRAATTAEIEPQIERGLLAGEALSRGLVAAGAALGGAGVAGEGNRAEGALAGGILAGVPASAFRGGRFYSRLHRALEKFPNNAADPTEVRTYLKKQGVKDAEIEWVLGDMSDITEQVPALRGRTRPSVSKEALLERARERGVRVGEKTFADRYTGDPAYLRAAESFHEAETPFYEALRKMEHAYPEAGSQDLGRALNAVYRGRGPVVGGTKYSKYSEPGGENYREVVLTLDSGPEDPGLKLLTPEQRDRLTLLNRREMAAAEEGGPPLTPEEQFEWSELRGRVQDARAHNSQEPRAYRSSHWEGVDNPFAHVRMSDRTGPNGEKILHVEEIQSDWAQQGRKKGFGDPEIKLREVSRSPTGAVEYEATAPDGRVVPSVWGSTPEQATEAARRSLRIHGGVPDMPFRETEDWLGLALRRVIDEAVEGGYDRIAWTPGAKQAKRYDLSKQVDAVGWTPWPAAGKDHGILTAYKDGGEVVKKTIPASELPDHIGKDVADRIMSAPEEAGGRRMLRGQELSIGGEGMHAFYDEMVPQQIRRYARSMGVEIDVEPVPPILPHPNAVPAGRSAEELAFPPSGFPSVLVPGKLKGKVQDEGQYLMAHGGGVVGGAAIGAGLDEENRGRGALIGAAAGAGAEGVAARRLRGPKAKPTHSESVQKVLGTVSKGEKGPGVLGKLLADTKAEGKRLGQQVYRQLIDEAAPLKRFGKEVGGDGRLAGEAQRALGWRSSAEARLRGEFREVLKLAEGNEEGVVALTKAERALELLKHGLEKTDIPKADLEAAVKELRAQPEVAAAADALRGYYRNLLEYKLRNGVLTQEQFDAIIEKGDYYVPFLRDFGSEINTSMKGGAGEGRLLSKRTGVRKMDEGKASSRTVDPFEQAIYDTLEAERRVAKQRVTNLVAEIVETHPEKALPFIREVQPERGPEGGIKPPTSKAGRIVEANVEGKRKYYEVTDPELYAAWAAFDPYVGGLAVKLLRPFKETLRWGVTANPFFALANGIRDFAMSVIQYPTIGIGRQAALTGGGAATGAAMDEENRLRGAGTGAAFGAAIGGGANMAKHIARTLDAMNDIMGPEVMGAAFGGTAGAFAGNEQDHPFLGFLAGAAAGATGGKVAGKLGLKGNRAAYEEWLGEGGSGFGFYARNQEDAQRYMRQLKREGVDLGDVLNPRSWAEAIGYISRAVEEAPRLARYKTLKGRGVGTAEAIAGSRDLSLDFGRIGAGTKGIAATNAFFNAQVQGWDKLVRLLGKKETWGTAATTIMAPSIALWTINKDNPEYWSRPQWERNLYWLVPKGEGEGFWRVPKPFEVGFIFASIPERLLDFAHQRDPEALRMGIGDLATQYGPGATLPLTTAAEPVIENIANHSFFRGRPVVDPRLERLPSELQYDERTSTVATKLGGATGISPQKIDNVIRGWTGSLGSEAMRVVSKAAREFGIDDRPAPMDRGGPFLARFETDPTSISDQEMALYRRWKRAEKAYAGAKALVDQGDGAGLRKYAERHRDDLLAHERLKEMRNQMADIWEARELIEQSAAPDARKKELLARLNSAVTQALGTMRKQELEAAVP